MKKASGIFADIAKLAVGGFLGTVLARQTQSNESRQQGASTLTDHGKKFIAHLQKINWQETGQKFNSTNKKTVSWLQSLEKKTRRK